MNIRQPPWYHDKKTQQAKLYNNKNPTQKVDTTPTLVHGGWGVGRGKTNYIETCYWVNSC